MRIGRSRGVSTVIGSVFFVIVTILITSNVFLWSISQHAQYNLAVMQCSQMDADRLNERIVITGEYSIEPPNVKVDAILLNEGPVSSQIVNLWAVDKTLNLYNFVSLTPINLGPGDTYPVSTSVYLGSGCLPLDNYDVWFITARGNRISFSENQYVTLVNIITAMGPLQINFNSLRWSTSSDSGTYQIPSGKTGVTWFVDVTNYGIQDITLPLDSGSAFRILGGTSGQTGEWCTGSAYPIPVGKTVTLSFSVEKSKTPTQSGTYPVIMTLLGYYGTNPNAHFGETIPFEAIKVT